jgi:hypothetical protein
MQIDLLRSERERAATLAEGHVRHSQHARIELDGGVDVRDGQDEMIEPVDRQHRAALLASSEFTEPGTGGLMSDSGSAC